MGLFGSADPHDVQALTESHEGFRSRLEADAAAAEAILRRVKDEAEQRIAQLKAVAEVHLAEVEALTRKFL